MRLGLKIAMVVVLVLAILIPLAMIRGTISERQQYRQQAVDEVTRSYAGEQGIAGATGGQRPGTAVKAGLAELTGWQRCPTAASPFFDAHAPARHLPFSSLA